MTAYIEISVGSSAAGAWGPLMALVHALVWLSPLAVSTFLLFARATNIRAAKRAVEDEAARVRAERDAFAEFRDRIAEADAVAPSEVPGGPVAVRQAAPGDLDRVRTAYEETVMATDHFDEDYDETFEENVDAEFSPDVAVAIEQGVALTPQLRAALLAQSEECRREREEFLAVLEDEHEALCEAESILGFELDTPDEPLLRYSYDQLREHWESVLRVRRQVESLLERRQRRIQDGYLPGPMVDDGTTFHEYLYTDLESRHPVLADAAEAVREIDDVQDELERSMARRI